MKTTLSAIATVSLMATAGAIDLDHFSNLEAAPEVLKVEIVKVEEDGPKGEDFAPMVYTAKVLQVDRTDTGLKVGDTIKIKHSYIHSGADYTGVHLTAPLGKGEMFVRLSGGGEGVYQPVSGASGLDAKGVDPAPEDLTVTIFEVEKGEPKIEEGNRRSEFLAPVVYTAQVLRVHRTKTGVKVGDTIKIKHSYVHRGTPLLGTNYRTAPLGKGQTSVRLKGGGEGVYHPVNEVDGFYVREGEVPLVPAGPGTDPRPPTAPADSGS